MLRLGQQVPNRPVMRLEPRILALALTLAAVFGACKKREDQLRQAVVAPVARARPDAHMTVEDRFRLAFMTDFARAVPDARITVKEPLLFDVTFAGDGGSVTVALDNVFRDCRGEMEGCDSAARLMRDATRAPATDEDGGDPATVRPMLHDARWMASVAAMMKDAPPGERAGNRLVSAPFVADLVIVYAFDGDDTVRMVSERDREKLGLAAGAIDALARKNLAAALPGPLPDELIERGIHQIHTDDSYEASRILLDERWNAPAGAVKGDLLVSAPTRDYVLYTGSRERPGVLKRFRTLVREYEATRGHPISRTILRRTSTGWQRAAAP